MPRAAKHDTEVLDRAQFVELVGGALARAPRTRRLAVLAIALDGVDDTTAPAGRDALLAHVESRLHASIRKQDVLARLAEDEYGVLLTGLRHPEDAQQAAARLARSLSIPAAHGGPASHLGCSIGVSFVGAAPAESAGDAMLGRAGMAVYLAQRQGGDRVVVFDAAARDTLVAAQPIPSF